MQKKVKLIAATKLQEYTNYYSENPLKSIWQELLLFTDFNVLKRIWKTDEDNYTYVTTSLIQAYEYFQASQQCSIKTKPLLLYYSFLNLTRGILLFKTNQTPNTSYHGLAKPLMDKDILNTSATSYNGLFKDLLTYYNYNCPNGTNFNFKQFIQGIPEVVYEMKTYFDIESQLYSLNVTHFIGGDVQIVIPKNVYLSNNSFSKLLEDFTKTENDSEIILIRNPIEEKDPNVKLLENIEIMKKYCVYSSLEYSYYYKTSNMPIPIAASYYGAMYLLSSIVRYFPIDISKFTLEQGEHSAAWFINHFCDTASRVYPNLMLNELMGTQIRYS
jgi:hypothetical protein